MKTSQFLAGMAVGAAIGAACALVCAPRSGRQTRRQVAERMGRLRGWLFRRERAARLRVTEAARRAEDEVFGRQLAEGG